MVRTKGGPVVFYIALLFLILLGGVTLIMVIQNFSTLMTSEHLMFLTLHLPGVPVLLLYLFGAFLGGLLLYAASSSAARRDAQELKDLRARIEDLEKAQTKSPSGSLAANFAPPPVVPMPGFASTGPLPYRQPFSGPLPISSTSRPLQQNQTRTNPLPNLPQPPRQLPSLSQQSAQQPPFLRQ